MLDRAPPRRAARAVLHARRLLRLGADRLLPGEVVLWEESMGVLRTRILGALAEHRVPDALGARAATAEELAERLRLDADALHRLLRAAAVFGYVRLDRRGRFRLTPVGRALREGHSHSLREWVRYMNLDSTQAAWAGVGETLRTGEPSFPAVHGRSVWDHFADHPEEERRFAASMREVSRVVEAAVLDGYPWPSAGTVCDVAGGVGTLVAAVLRRWPGLTGVVVDSSGVLAEADGYLRAQGVRERVTLSEGNMFERIEAAADLYLLKNILHDWDDPRCVQVLRTVRAAMPSGARVVLVEDLQDRNRVEPAASLIDVHMLTQCDGGRQRSVPELHALLRQADLRPGEVHLTAGPALVEGLAA